MGFFVFLCIFIQHCFICRLSNSTVSENAGIDARTVATLALAVRCSDNFARSHPLLLAGFLRAIATAFPWGWSSTNPWGLLWVCSSTLDEPIFELFEIWLLFYGQNRQRNPVSVTLVPQMGAKNQVGIGLSYRPASLCSLATQFQTQFLELIPRPIAGLKFSTQFLKSAPPWYGIGGKCYALTLGFHGLSPLAGT